MNFQNHISFRFDEAKATQVATRLVGRNGNRLSHLALMKMIYIVDREALRRWERPVIGGRYCSMKHGTVISEVLDLMRSIEGWDDPSVWTTHLAKVGNEMHLTESFRTDALAPAEVDLVDEVFETYGGLGTWEIRDLTHTFGEWEDVGDSSRPIPVENILVHVGKSAEEVARLAEEVKYLNFVDELIAS